MNILGKSLMGATAATALAVAAPAQARDNNGIDGGDILAGVLLIGGVAAVIAAASDDDDDRYDARYDRRYDPRHDRRNNDWGRNRRGQYGYQHRQISPRAAVNRCARAAQQRASRYGRARVTQITDVDRNRNGYEVEGRLVVNEGRWGGRRWNASYNEYDRGRFSCRIRDGRVDRVRVRGID